MDLKENWPRVREAFEASIHSSLHCAIGTAGADGYPHITPIGHIFLRDDFSAFYFEEHPKQLPLNLQRDPRVCLLLVNSKRWFWLSALYRGRFASPPGIRLFGVAGERRLASDDERAAYQARVRAFRRLKGYQLIWKDLHYVRDIKLERFAPVVYPTMTDGLYK